MALQWTAALVIRSLALFIVAGIAEIAGGWLIWQVIREHKPWWWFCFGAQFARGSASGTSRRAQAGL